MRNTIFLAVGAAVAFVIYLAAFRVHEGTQALITQFGRVVGEPITQAGLHWKIPFVQEARVFDKRILEWDGDANQIPTKDKKFIWVDTTARWRIKDAVKFAETVIQERGAQARLDSILDGATRDIISKHNLVEAVRNTNAIIDSVKEKQAELEKAKKDPKAAADVEMVVEIEEEITGDVEPITVGREKISEMILARAREKVEPLGIEIIDVQLRRIAYEQSVEAKVYDRMISERKRIAEKIRSIGKGEQAKIRGTLSQDLKKIESEAYKKSKEIRGKAEARAIKIYAASLKQSPQFYDFLRTLEAYKKTIPDRGKFILSTDSEFLRLLKKR